MELASHDAAPAPERGEAADARCGRKRRCVGSSRRGRDCGGEVRALLSPDPGGDVELDPGDEDEGGGVTGDDSSLSDAVSDAPTSVDDDAANHRQRPSRAVSFGPDLVIASRGGDAGCRADGDVADERRDDPVARRPDVESSPSAGRRPPAPRRSSDRRPPAPVSPALPSVGDSPAPRSTCAGQQRRAGEPAPPLIGNGSVRGGVPGAARLARPLSSQTPLPFSAAQFQSVGRKPRRLPVPSAAAAQRRPALYARRAGPSSPRDAAATDHVIADSTPAVSLAELLAPPFGDSARQIRPTARTAAEFAQQQQHQQPVDANSFFDDDSGTDI